MACALVGAQLSCRRKGKMCPILCAHQAPGVMTVSDVGQFGVYSPAVVIRRAQTMLLSARFFTSSGGGGGTVTDSVSDDHHCSPWIVSTRPCGMWSTSGIVWACTQVRRRIGEMKSWMIGEVVDGDGKRERERESVAQGKHK